MEGGVNFCIFFRHASAIELLLLNGACDAEPARVIRLDAPRHRTCHYWHAFVPGLDAWAEVIERGYEGLVAKDEASVYEGGATRRWVKVKQKDWTVAEDGWRRRIFGEDGDAATCS